jgi:Transposase DDE domain group 1
LSKVLSAPSRRHFSGNDTARRLKITVSADGQGLVSQAGTLLLAEAARVTGPGRGLPAGLARCRAPRVVHDPGKIVADLVVALALGGDCLADIAVLRAQPELAGPAASDPVVSRLVTALAANAPAALRAIRKARAAARERAWALAGDAAPGGDGPLIPVEIDATIVTRAFGGRKGRSHPEEVVRVPSAGRVRRPRRWRGRGSAEYLAAAWERRVEHRGGAQ